MNGSFQKTARIRPWVQRLLFLILVVSLVIFFQDDGEVRGPLVWSMFGGWWMYPMRVMPRVRIDWGGVFVFCVGLAIVLLSFHSTARWWLRWWREQSAKGSEVPESSTIFEGEGQWSIRASVTSVLIVLLMFATGIAMSAIVHQVIWIATGPRILEDIAVQSREDEELSNYRNQRIPVGDSWLSAISVFLSIAPPEVAEKAEPFNSPANAPSFRGISPSFYCPSMKGPVVNREKLGLIHYAANVHWMGKKISQLNQAAMLFGETNAGLDPWGSPTNVRDPLFGFKQKWGGGDRGKLGFGSEHWRGTQIVTIDGSVQWINYEVDSQVKAGLIGVQIDDAGQGDLHRATFTR